MVSKMQIAFYVLVFLFIFAIDESKAGPQMCNQFTGCNVTINVCKTKCNQKHRGGFGFCATQGPTPAPSKPTEGLDHYLTQLAKVKPGKDEKCRVCMCRYESKAKKCPRQTPPNC